MRSPKWLGGAAAVLLSLLGWNNSSAQEKVETKKAVKARQENQKEGGPYREAARTLFGARVFQQAAISPDGKKVAWVEPVIKKNGMPTGDTVIYVADSEGKGSAKRISAGTGDAIFAEGSVAWSPGSGHQRIARRAGLLAHALLGGGFLAADNDHVAHRDALRARNFVVARDHSRSPRWIEVRRRTCGDFP